MSEFNKVIIHSYYDQQEIIAGLKKMYAEQDKRAYDPEIRGNVRVEFDGEYFKIIPVYGETRMIDSEE
jgi:hypothetical protein